MTGSYDTIVAGLGAMGAATLYQLSLRGVKALGIDRFHPPHRNGSSTGESRITRQAVGEGPEYVNFALRSHEIWRQLEGETGESLLMQYGLAVIAPSKNAPVHHGKKDFVGQSARCAVEFGIPHEVLNGAELSYRHPQFILDGDEAVYYEPGAGSVFPERCIAAQLNRAEALGAEMRLGETVGAWTQTGDGVSVTTDKGTYSAANLVICAGAWMQDLADVPMPLKIFPQTLHWFPVDEPEAYSPGKFPVFIWMYGPTTDDYLYGFPRLNGGNEIKVATEQYDDEWNGAPLNPLHDPEALQAEMYRRHVSGRLKGVRPNPGRSAGCLYTVAPGSRFLIDRVPGSDRVWLVSACSGHGFKHSAGIGETMAELVTGAKDHSAVSAFALNGV